MTSNLQEMDGKFYCNVPPPNYDSLDSFYENILGIIAGNVPQDDFDFSKPVNWPQVSQNSQGGGAPKAGRRGCALF